MNPPKILILGAGNLLLSDEGFGVHVVRHLEATYEFGAEVELFDAGTLGILAAHKLEEANCVYLIDVVLAEAPPGTVFRYDKSSIMLRQIPVKVSPHQAGVQEMLLVSQLRGRCPEELHLLGVVPDSFAPGDQLSPLVAPQVQSVSQSLVEELRARGLRVERRA